MNRADTQTFSKTVKDLVHRPDKGLSTNPKDILYDLLMRSALAFNVHELDDAENPARNRYSQPIPQAHPFIVLAAISSDILIKTPPRKKARIPRKISGKKVKKKVSKRNPDFVLRQHRDDCVLCEPASDFKIANWQRERLDELVEAHEAAPQGWERPHIICFGELAYSPPKAISCKARQR